MEDFTYDDYIEWDGRWELINGAPIPIKPVQAKEYRDLLLKALVEVEEAIKPCDSCLVVGSADWKIDTDTIVRPAISLICDEPNGAYITKSPKMVIEIVEPDRVDYYESIKFDLYKNEGVPFYILLYLEQGEGVAFRLFNGEYIKCARFATDRYQFTIDRCGFELDFGVIFSKDEE